MRYLARIVAIIGVFAVLRPSDTLRAQPNALPPVAGTPREGVLLLKNGQVMPGRITWSGDHYFVDRNGLQMGVRTEDVELTARDLDDAYHQKRAKVAKDDLDGHQTLAAWCIRQELLGYAASEIAQCEALYPRNARTDLLMRQLQSAVRVTNNQKEAAADAAAKDSTVEDGSEQEDSPAVKSAASAESNATAALSSDAMETFVTAIQPMLINQCATGGCHGGASSADLKLYRFDPRKSPSRVYTERNLTAVLKYINRENPAASRLLVAPSEPHGRAKTAVFSGRLLEQRAELAAWIYRVSGSRQANDVAASTSPNGKTTGSSRNSSGRDRTVKRAGFDAARGGKPNVESANIDIQAGAAGTANPHDPSVFNRRYFPKGPREERDDATVADATQEESDMPNGFEPEGEVSEMPTQAAGPANPQASRPQLRPVPNPSNRPQVGERPKPRSPGRPALPSLRPTTGVPNYGLERVPDDEIPPFESIEEGEIAGEQSRQ